MCIVAMLYVLGAVLHVLAIVINILYVLVNVDSLEIYMAIYVLCLIKYILAQILGNCLFPCLDEDSLSESYLPVRSNGGAASAGHQHVRLMDQ